MVVKRVATANTYLHLDIIHTILLRVPVKSLTRFKAVCKSWNDIISDYEFAINHLQLNSRKQHNIFLWQPSIGEDYRLVKFENGKFQVETIWENPSNSKKSFLLCSADGLALLSTSNSTSYLLWNPSTKQKTTISCPYRGFESHSTIFGFCRGPTLDDYKIIAARCSSYYAVYSCKNKAWSDKKEFPETISNDYENAVLFIDGLSFWVMREMMRKIIYYFDPRDETFNKLQKPSKIQEDGTDFFLASFTGCLCLYNNVNLGMSMQQLRIWILRDNNVDYSSSNSWSQLMAIDRHFRFEPLHWTTPLFFTENNELVIRRGFAEGKFCIYNSMKKKFKDTVFSESKFFFKYSATSQYVDSLFFPQ